jgi:U4/U6.U5 tri-snRNP-associated protein 2
VEDASLNDIKYNLRPLFTKELVNQLDSEPLSARALDGSEYLPGCLGLNNLKQTDFVNVILQTICRIEPLRDFYLFNTPTKPLPARFAELVKKMWNPKNFKGHVSPHELLQAVSDASEKRFKIGVQRDPVQFLVWFLN